MGRKRRDEDQLSEQNAAPADGAEPKPRRRRRRKLALLVALAGAATYLVRRNQRKAELDEGIWHEAPTPTGSATSTAPASTAPTS
jgi:ferric-dicitrate binding protein FerR (iron transport regulator)